MTFSQVISRSTLAAMMTLTVSLGASVNAEPIRVTRGPNGATHIVNSERLPLDAKLQPQSEARDFPALAQRGPGGAAHILNDSETSNQSTTAQRAQRLITRGPNGAGFLTNK